MTTFNQPLITAPPESAIACNLAAIPADERAAHTVRAASLLFDSAATRTDLPDGAIWQFPIERYADVVRFIANERRCCAFFSFVLTILPERAGVQLQITGSATVAAFLQAELAQHGIPLPGATAILPAGDHADYPVVCDLTTLTPEENIAIADLAKRLLCTDYAERQELPDGYVWRFAPDEYEALARFIEADSRCCAFLTHRLAVAAEGGSLWLSITGSATAKAAVGADLERLHEEIAQATPSS
ncbi:MAG: hypothetical protein H0T53_15725 [Herpetosiphonaceae bacterium]|nr:hypothetical protein [Herpetosiphonaceae bacterium]